MAHPRGIGQIIARRAAQRASQPAIRKSNRRAAQDRKFGEVAAAVPSTVQVVADWQLYRQKRIYSAETNTSVAGGLRAFFRYVVPIDRAWLVHGITWNVPSLGLPGNVRLQLRIPNVDNSGFTNFIIGLLPQPAGSSSDDRVVNFVGNKAPTPFFAPEGPFYAPSGSQVIVEMLTAAPAIASVGSSCLAYELPPTEQIDEIDPVIGFI